MSDQKPIDDGSVRKPDKQIRRRQDNQKSYYEKLKDPRWQKLRLRIFERDGFACLVCESKENPLTVHHGQYKFGQEPWEAHPDSLWTLCEPCHKACQAQLAEIKELIGETFPTEYGSLIEAILHVRTIGEFRPHPDTVDEPT